jgi:hypothetical protein
MEFGQLTSIPAGRTQTLNAHRVQLETDSGKPVCSWTVPAEVDPNAAMDEEALRWESGGWAIQHVAAIRRRNPGFFIRKGDYRWFVGIYPESPVEL